MSKETNGYADDLEWTMEKAVMSYSKALS